MSVAVTPVAPIDPLGPPRRPGCYLDDLVQVRTIGSVGAVTSSGNTRTKHFDIATTDDGRADVQHSLGPSQIDDDIAGLVAAEIIDPGLLHSGLFERLVTGIVLSSGPDPVTAWQLFYGNTLERIDSVTHQRPDRPAPMASGIIQGYAPVYTHAEALLAAGTALELGSCFGFLSMRLALHGRPTIASDISAGAMRLLRAVAPTLGSTLGTVAADAARAPLADRSVDNVLALHLLEHLDHESGSRAVGEAIRLARRRVVVAVPLEDEPDETWGHVRTVTLDDLRRWGQASGHPYHVHEHHGGWLVIDTANG